MISPLPKEDVIPVLNETQKHFEDFRKGEVQT